MPKLDLLNRTGWLATFFLMPFVFWLYYAQFYPKVVKEYESQFTQVVEFGEAEPKLQVRYPNYIADFVEREIIIEAENSSDVIQAVSVSVVGTITNTKNLTRENRPLLHIVGIAETGEVADSNASSSVEFKIPPRASARRKLFVSLGRSGWLNDQSVVSVILTFYRVADSGRLLALSPDPPQSIKLDFNRWEAFRQSAIKNLILSPWSNGILVALVLAIVWISEQSPLFGSILRARARIMGLSLAPGVPEEVMDKLEAKVVWRRRYLEALLYFADVLFSSAAILFIFAFVAQSLLFSITGGRSVPYFIGDAAVLLALACLWVMDEQKDPASEHPPRPISSLPGGLPCGSCGKVNEAINKHCTNCGLGLFERS